MNFAEFITEQKNTHMTHIEDKVLYGGVRGTREAILALRSLRNTLGGEHDGSVSVKWDGAPAIFAGIDPRNNNFFVAKKGIFNKSPKVYYTAADVDADTSGDLATKLKQALQYLPEIGIKGVIQGDFLFSKSDLRISKIKGKQYVTFHPNTIVYAIPNNTEMSKRIKKAKIGIVWHTTYTGNSFENMKASYGVNVSKLRQTSNVWSQDAMLRDMTNYTMTKKIRRKSMNILVTLGTYLTKLVQLPLKLWKIIKSWLNSLKHLIIVMYEKVKSWLILAVTFPSSLIGSNKDTKKKLKKGKQKKAKQPKKPN